jgi:hypothetical protein
MRPKLTFYYLALLFTAISWSQETVFITSDKDIIKDDEPDIYTDGRYFAQFGLSMPFKSNPDSGRTDEDSGESGDWFIPDGLSGYAGIGLHYREWAGISANAGLDYKIDAQLFSVPVYASLILNPHFNEDLSFMLEGSYGRAFALGRGNLNGAYKKIRAGLLIEGNMYIFADVSQFGYSLHQYKNIGSISIGISLLDFF